MATDEPVDHAAEVPLPVETAPTAVFEPATPVDSYSAPVASKTGPATAETPTDATSRGN